MKCATLITFVGSLIVNIASKTADKPVFKILEQHNENDSPLIQVTFMNGVQDEFDLIPINNYNSFEKRCHYHGRLRNHHNSSVAVTGCLDKDDSQMEITILSDHTRNKMFRADLAGNVEIVENPFKYGALSQAVHIRREIDGWVRKGDEEINEEIEETSFHAKRVKMPSKLKAVIRFGYDEGMRTRLGNRTFDDWIKEVFVHTQAHFKHPSLGTELVFEIQEDPIFASEQKWSADENVYDAREKTLSLNLKNVDVMSWWCDKRAGDIAGISFVGGLCSSYNLNLNEYQESPSSAGYVLAHELGHTLGMSHDFDERHGGVDGPCNGKGIMSYGTFDKSHWSSCSRSDFEQHYSSRNWKMGCLDDVSDSNQSTSKAIVASCNSVVSSSNTVLQSENFPQNYPNNVNCDWIIRFPEGQRILLEFESFSLENHWTCNYDWVEVRDGPSISSPLIGTKRCGNRGSVRDSIISSTNELFVHFHSDSSVTKQGFKIWVYNLCAQLYEHDRYNGWVENVGETENGQILHRNDMVSSVKVRPGCTLNAYRHINLEDHLFTATDDMNYVGHPNNDHMTSFSCSCDETDNESSTADPVPTVGCNTEVMIPGTEMVSKNFPERYPNNDECVHKILFPEGERIQLVFLAFDVERHTQCQYDWLEVRDGDNDRAPLIGSKICGTVAPNDIISSGNTLFLRFHSDNSVRRTGYRVRADIGETAPPPGPIPPSEGCGIKPASIVGGSPATPYSIPWQVALVPRGQTSPFCGGTLISASHVLTAAHCTEAIPDFDVIVGEHYVSNSADGTRHQICRFSPHPNYNSPSQINNDFSIVHLREPVIIGLRAAPACLPDSELAGNYLSAKSLIVSGWGTLSSAGSTPNVLHKVTVPGLTNEECAIAYDGYTITNQMVCAGDIEEGGIDSCQGDSGGPLTYSLNGRTTVVGVVSWGVGCGREGKPGVYARVTEALDFISRELQQSC